MDLLSEGERFCISLMGVPGCARRIKALQLKFAAAEKAAEAAAIFKVCEVLVRQDVLFLCYFGCYLC